MEINAETLLECATAAAQAAGQHALTNWKRRWEVHRAFKHDVKLQLDIEAQAKAQEIIRARFPGHAILAEEDDPASHHARPRSPFRWIIDPIDGTVNFSHGFPIWCSSVAVEYKGEVVAGAVYAPALGNLYQAAIGRPALCDGTEIKVSDVNTLDAAIVFTGLDKSVDPSLPPFALFERIAANTQKARIIGSAALDMCQVAAGHGDGYFEAGIYLWDIAAGSLIVRQAGGQTELLGYQSDNRLRFLATNGRIHAALKQLVDVPWNTVGI